MVRIPYSFVDGLLHLHQIDQSPSLCGHVLSEVGRFLQTTLERKHRDFIGLHLSCILLCRHCWPCVVKGILNNISCFTFTNFGTSTVHRECYGSRLIIQYTQGTQYGRAKMLFICLKSFAPLDACPGGGGMYILGPFVRTLGKRKAFRVVAA